MQHSCPLSLELWGTCREWGPVLRGRLSLAPATASGQLAMAAQEIILEA